MALTCALPELDLAVPERDFALPARDFALRERDLALSEGDFAIPERDHHSWNFPPSGENPRKIRGKADPRKAADIKRNYLELGETEARPPAIRREGGKRGNTLAVIA